ncbi:MAG: glycosyltransferase [Acidobacteriota bacterium]
MNARPLRALWVTCEWPSPDAPQRVPFLVQRATFLRRAGVDLEVFAFRGAGRPARYLAARRACALRLADARAAGRPFDLIDAQWGQSAMAVPTRRAGAPLVVTFRGSDLEGLPDARGRDTLRGHLLRALSRRAARRADAWVLVADHLRLRLPRAAPSLVATVPSGVDRARFRPLDIDARAAARRASPLLRDFAPDARLVVFAASPANPIKRFDLARAAVDRLPARLGARLVVLQDVDHADVPRTMAACDALLMTSRHEGSPNVVKEALACGLPVVATDVGDVRARFGDAPGCRVVDGPVDALRARLATQLEALLASGARADPAWAAALDEAALTDRLIDVYRRVAARGARESTHDG